MNATKKLGMVAAAACLIVATNAQADATWLGLSNATCEEYAATPKATREHWLSGYLSGVSVGGGRTIKITMDEAHKIVDDYCKQKPKDNVSEALQGLYRKVR